MADPIIKIPRKIDKIYLRYIRLQRCVACGHRPVDPDHLIARGWKEPKRNDFSVIPLCRPCHTERGTIGILKFQEKWGVNIWYEAWNFAVGFLLVKIEAMKD